MRDARLVPLILGLSLPACGGSAAPPPPPGPSTNNTLDVATGNFDVPVGDSLTCFYTSTTTDREVYLGNATGTQGPGGHHVILYYTDTTQPVGHHPCSDTEMITWHQLAGADTNKEPIIAFPEGAAVKVPAGKQLVVQSHYINTTGATQTVDDTMSVQLLEAKDIKQFLNFFAMFDLQFQIPAQATYKSVTTCTVTKDINSVILLGHMHELGKHYTLEQIDDQGMPVATLYDHDWSPQYMTHPPLITTTLDKPTAFKAGTRLQQTCEWNNLTAQPVSFPTEMCVMFMFYYPDQGFMGCEGQPKM